MPDRQHYTQQQVIDALQQTRGLVYLAAKLLGCHVGTITNYCKRYPAVQAVRDAGRGALIDLAELKLWESVQRGEAWGISLVLKTLGRDRGYVDRQEITGKDGGPVQHAHLHLWEERLQSVHAAMAQRKAAIMLERNGHAADPIDPED